MLDPALVIHAYREGLFPMAMEAGEIGWFSPDPRGILPLDAVHVPSRLRRRLRRGDFAIRIDSDFGAVIAACAEDREEGTWISEEIRACYTALHHAGFAHSVEVWQGDVLAGGLYGVHLGGAFFGESMFHRVTDASKVALVWLTDHLAQEGFTLLDIQWTTPHLERFGAVAIPREVYLARLAETLDQRCRFVPGGSR